MRFYSVVIPVYNRPTEVKELLTSLLDQTYSNFEVIIVDDGSKDRSERVADSFKNKLDIQYFYKENEGQGFSRNYGFKKAKGDYYVVFDSDCLIPSDYFENVDTFLSEQAVDAFGGPDKAHKSFNSIQKAISYSMTSPFTTGGIRGNKKHLGKFHPRSFNMGISKKVYEKTKGYKLTRMGEDIEFSIRILKEGFKTALIPSAFVYHKRRSTLSQFYKQLHFFGRARVNVNRIFKGEMKAIHLMPLVFLCAFWFWLSTPFWYYPLFKVGAAAVGAYYLAIFSHALIKERGLKVASLAIITSFIQLYAYGMGIVSEIVSPRGNQPFAQK